MAATDLVQAKTSFIATTEPGVPVPVRQGQVAHAGHPVVVQHQDLWEPLTVDFEVESPKKAASAKKDG
jgi:hypothetical protein